MVHLETVVIEKRGTTPGLKLEIVTKQLALLYEVVAQLNLLVALDFQIQTIGLGEKTRFVAGCFEEAYLEYCSVIGKVGIAIQYSHENPDPVNLVYCLQKSQGLVFLS
jgi:hypothetical protein